MPRTLAPLALPLFACATAGPLAPIEAPPLVPQASERVAVDHAVILADVSGSIEPRGLFRTEKSLLQSFVSAMPAGDYRAGSIAFGGDERQSFPLARFDRGRLRADAGEVRFLDENTPLDAALAEAGTALRGASGPAAVVLFSDGLPTDAAGRPTSPAGVVAAARGLVGSRPDGLCLHTVQLGEDPEGGALLRRLAELSECGSYRRALQVNDVASLHQLERDVFLGKALPAVAAAPADADSDGDGVYDRDDRCPGTPRGAVVDPRGCWVLRGLNFDTDSSAIASGQRGRLDEVVGVLRRNPGVRIRIGGHTDTRGAEAYNQRLSERRASAVLDYLVRAGIDASRFEVRGFGESQPLRPNDTPENLYQNRRTELSAIE